MDKYSFLSWNEEKYRMHTIADGARTYEVYRKAPEENAFNGFAKKMLQTSLFYFSIACSESLKRNRN